MENNYIKNGNNRVEYPCLTQGEGKKRVRRGREEGKHWIGRQMLRMAAVLWVMMELGMVSAMAQTPKYDYSGKYYIGGPEYIPANTSSNYYLCPTENWYGYNPTTGGYVIPDGGMPFMTTYQCRKSDANPVYTPANAVWIIEKYSTVNGIDYYTIKRECDGKYLTYNGSLNGTSNSAERRLRVHLEAQETISDNALFVIAPSETSGAVNISTKQLSTNNRFLNVNKGNKPYLYGFQNPESNNGLPIDLGGTIGLYNATEGTSQWFLEELIVRPTITYNSSNLIDITAEQANAKLVYTTDGSTPTFSPLHGTYVDENTVTFDPEDGTTTIKAIAVVDNEVSNVATFYTLVLWGENHKYLIQSQANYWTFLDAPNDYHFYMIPGDDEEINSTNVTKVNTTSLFRPSMEWYFLNAGVEAGVQYYYIVNSHIGKNLCYDTDKGVHMETNNDNTNKFKFRIAVSPTAGTYNIIPYGVTSEYKFFNKSSGNGSPNSVSLHNKNNDANSRWKFVLPSELDRNAPFTASDPSSLSYPYYTIQTVNNNTNYYLAPGTTNTNVQTLTTNDASALWYFEVAQEADATDWLTYYHIRNVVTGDYLYFDKDSYDSDNNASCFKTSGEVDPTADSCMFTWAKTASATANYYIVPKSMKDASQNNIGTLYRNSNTNIRLDLTRTTGTRVWTFTSSTFNFDRPTISYDATLGGYVISSTQTGAEYYYTTDGTTPVPINTTTHYTDAIQVADWDPSVTEFTIKAIAAKNGDGSDSSYVVSRTVYRVSTPVITPQTSGTVTITCDTVGARIYYAMDDTQPTSVPLDANHLYTVPIEGAGGKYITAIAVKDGLINSYLAQSGQIVFTCATPVIRKTSATTFTITCDFPTDGVTIYYETGVDPEHTPTPSNSSLNSILSGEAVTFDLDDLPFTVKAIAYATNYNNSAVATQELTVDLPLDPDGYYVIATNDDFGTFVTMVNGSSPDAKYKIINDINAYGVGTIITPFTGELKGVAKTDGTFPVVSNLSHAIFNTVSGGKVYNVMLDNVVISSGTNVGAICNEATGTSRIYNCGLLATGSTVRKDTNGYDEITSCSSTIGGSGCVGGLVGLLDGTSRVINCFSYANITDGSYRGGIVGKNNVAYDPSDYKTMVMNCMFYGDITTTGSPTQIAPVYGGEIITNDGDYSGVNNFNYFRIEANYVQNTAVTKTYNCALGAETRFLQRFEFFRHLLNSNRELAAWWATGNVANKNEMLKWVMIPDSIGTSTPYPVLRKPVDENNKAIIYPSVVNYTPSDVAIDANNEHRNEGRKLTQMGTNGELLVTIRMGSGGNVFAPPTGASITNSDTLLIITDKDPAHFNFNYGKVQLPYYNQVGTKNYNKASSSDQTSRVVTGWKIVEITGGTAGGYTTGADVTYTNGELTATPYNFADREHKGKDLYGTSGRIFNQGAYWDVPIGVTAITIEPYWAKAVYLSDQYWDVTYKNGTESGTAAGSANDAMVTPVNVTTVGGGEHSTSFNNQAVKNTMSAAVEALSINSSRTVYDYAVVLVGNYHHTASIEGNKPYTVMSVDQDGDNEPDYSIMLRFNARNQFHPLRYDFLNLMGLGMAQKTTGGTGSYNFGIMQPIGWFEATNTSLFRVTQLEYDRSNRVAAPYIVQGGVIEQWVSGQSNGVANTTTYFHVGGNVWFKEFHRGTHQDVTLQSKHPPVSVTGGDYDEFYLTGLYTANVVSYEDNAECYINGGCFGTVCGAAMEGIGKANGADDTGNITWQIQNADIHEFFAGGLNADKPVTGNLHTIITGSYVDIFCGGPKFGDISAGKTVTTVATDCTFGTFFGAGYGGNSYSRQAPYNHNNIMNFPHSTSQAGNHSSWNDWLEDYYTRAYNETYGGVSTQFSYQFLPMSSNVDNVARIFVDYVKFSMATTHNVNSTLMDCTVTGNFYGGGSLGKVDGNVTSTLDGCTVKGNVFGAGFSASLPSVEVDSVGFRTEPYYYEDLGTYRTGVKGVTTTYTWEHGNAPGINTNDSFLYTTLDLSPTNLGSVSGAVTLTLKGSTTVGTFDGSGTLTSGGNVYGGGDESAVNDPDNPANASTSVILQGKTHVGGNVYGGGNRGLVSGNSSVTIEPEP